MFFLEETLSYQLLFLVEEAIHSMRPMDGMLDIDIDILPRVDLLWLGKGTVVEEFRDPLIGIIEYQVIQSQTPLRVARPLGMVIRAGDIQYLNRTMKMAENNGQTDIRLSVDVEEKFLLTCSTMAVNSSL